MRDIDRYSAAFLKECQNTYPTIDRLERELGFAAPEPKLTSAARVLACPLKVNPPNWQHGRVIYALVRWYLAKRGNGERVVMLDIGTAKGFSALCMRWALDDAGFDDSDVFSVDVIDPKARVARNTVAEVYGLKTLHEILSPWHEAKRIRFLKSTGADILSDFPANSRVQFAFVDGKHTYTDVKADAVMLSELQRPDDIVLFDDIHLPGINRAVGELEPNRYHIDRIPLLPQRAYAIGTRK